MLIKIQKIVYWSPTLKGDFEYRVVLFFTANILYTIEKYVYHNSFQICSKYDLKFKDTLV